MRNAKRIGWIAAPAAVLLLAGMSLGQTSTSTAKVQNVTIETAGVRKRRWTFSKKPGSRWLRLIAYAMREAPNTPELLEISNRIAPRMGT